MSEYPERNNIARSLTALRLLYDEFGNEWFTEEDAFDALNSYVQDSDKAREGFVHPPKRVTHGHIVYLTDCGYLVKDGDSICLTDAGMRIRSLSYE